MDYRALQQKLFEMDPVDPTREKENLKAMAGQAVPQSTAQSQQETVTESVDELEAFAKLAGVDAPKKQMINEDTELSEKATSQAQQKAAGAALAAKRGDIPKSDLEGASKEMLDMSEKDLEDFAGTKHKGIPAKKGESVEEGNEFISARDAAIAADKETFVFNGRTYHVTDKDKKDAKRADKRFEEDSRSFDTEAFRAAFEEMVEAKSKPDFLDIDKDGDKKEPMKKAVKDKEDSGDSDDKDGKMTDKQKKYFGKKDESVEEGKSPHKKGSQKYKDQMAAKHASMNEEDSEIDGNMDMEPEMDDQQDADPEHVIDMYDEADMAVGQLEFIKYAAEEIRGHFKMGFDMEEWFQNKLSRVHGTMMSLHAYIEGEEGKAGMNESAYKDKNTKKAMKNKTAEEQSVDEAGKLKGGADDPCWKGYKMVGMKKKGGKEVPNCVPRESLGENTSFEDLVKLFKESGGQQKIYATDEPLFKWAARVSENKFGRTNKAELFAGLVYERNGGDFEIADVLNEASTEQPTNEITYRGYRRPSRSSFDIGRTGYGPGDDLGAADKRDFKRREMEAELGDEPANNYAVTIDGKRWKVFSSERAAQKAANTIKSKYGKDAQVFQTGSPATN